MTINVRARDGLTFQGGTSTGQTVADSCEVRANLPELGAGLGTALGPGLVGSFVGPTNPYCHVAYGVLTHNAIWLQPLTILTARMAKIIAEFTF